MENNFYKHAYKCGICGTEYSSIEERNKCEAACIKKRNEEELKKAEAKKKEEMDIRKKEVDDAIRNAQDLIDKYMADYGAYSYSKSAYDPYIWRFLKMLP